MRVVGQDPRGFWIIEQEPTQWERDENGELVIHRINGELVIHRINLETGEADEDQ